VELKQLDRQLGTTMVDVTHDQVEAMTLADRIAVLEDGHLRQIGTPAELYRQPTNRFVAGFIGSPAMSFLEEVEPGVVIGVRPHEVLLGDGPHQAEIEVVETLGFESFVHLRLGRERLVARVEGTPPALGPTQLRLLSTHRFDPEAGGRLPSEEFQ
jgi:ABC-type sugar transport system ATPase subunit